MSVKCLIYCCKAEPYLFGHYVGFDTKYQYDLTKCKQVFFYHKNVLNGKIVASFDCEKVEEFTIDYRGNKEQNIRIEKDSCVPLSNLIDYQKENHFLYAIHISNLEIFDEPKELSEYCLFDPDYYVFKNIKKAPQNMCKVVKEPQAFFTSTEEYILISIKPEWVAKILNGEKTIEVRKQVVNTLKGLI